MQSKRKPRKAADLTYDWQRLSPEDAAETVNQRDPRRYSLGYCARDVTTKLFFWFASADEMLAFIAEVDSHIYFGDDAEDLEPTRGELRRIRAEWNAGKIASNELMNIINEYFSPGYATLEWMGQFADLCAGQGEFAADLVDVFLGDESADDEPSSKSRTVPEEKIPDFIEFLQEFGI